jgi:hypothetical protein
MKGGATERVRDAGHTRPEIPRDRGRCDETM